MDGVSWGMKILHAKTFGISKNCSEKQVQISKHVRGLKMN